MKRVCIIGAGASGLCAARQLSALDPAPDIVVYEQSREVGGVWVYRDEADVDQEGYSVQGRMYKNMRCACHHCTISTYTVSEAWSTCHVRMETPGPHSCMNSIRRPGSP